MSFVDHRCRTCGHARTNTSSADTCNGGHCPCGVTHDYGPPEVIRTFTDSGALIEALTKPGGSVLTGGTACCDCDACKALYATTTNAA